MQKKLSSWSIDLIQNIKQFLIDTYENLCIDKDEVLIVLNQQPNNIIKKFIQTSIYKNKESSVGYNESSEFGGDDPYSGSKAAAENIFHSYIVSFKKL